MFSLIKQGRALAYVGIGTNSPNDKLSIQRSAATAAYAGITDGTIRNVLGIAADDSALVGTVSNHDLNLISNGTAKAIVKANGNVGIGTTTPNNKLSIYGGRIETDNLLANQSAIQFSAAGVERSVLYRPAGSVDLRVWGTGLANDVMTWNTTNGNVGIGTTTPAHKLDVAGDVNVTGNFKVNGVNLTDGGIQSGVTNVVTLGAACSTPGSLAKTATDDLVVCDDSPTVLDTTDCSSFGVAINMADGGGLVFEIQPTS